MFPRHLGFPQILLLPLHRFFLSLALSLLTYDNHIENLIFGLPMFSLYPYFSSHPLVLFQQISGFLREDPVESNEHDVYRGEVGSSMKATRVFVRQSETSHTFSAPLPTAIVHSVP